MAVATNHSIAVEDRGGMLCLFPQGKKARAALAPRAAVFLDRDGVVNRTIFRPNESTYDSPYTAEELELLPEVPQALRRLKKAGLAVLVVSNQPGVAKGQCDIPALVRITKRLLELLGPQAKPDGLYYCLHHPTKAEVEALRIDCACRKPKPGLLLAATQDFNIDLKRSYLIGDNATDIRAGQAAGCRTYFIPGPATRLSPADPEVLGPCQRAKDLPAAVDSILEDTRGGRA